MTITDAIHEPVLKVPRAAWTVAVEPDGEIRDVAWVAGLDGDVLIKHIQEPIKRPLTGSSST